MPRAAARPMRSAPRCQEDPADRVELGTTRLQEFAYPRPSFPPGPLRFTPDVPAKRGLLDRFVRIENASPDAREVLYRDLSVLPRHILELLGDERLNVVVLAPGQTLADTPFLRHLGEEEYRAELSRAGPLLEETALAAESRWKARLGQREPLPDREFQLAMTRYHAAREIAAETREKLDRAGLAFEVEVLPDSVELGKFARSHGLQDPADLDRWTKALRDLNGDRVRLEAGNLSAEAGVVLVPYPYHRGSPVPERPFREAVSRTEASVSAALGLHDAERRLVMLAEAYVRDPAPELGHYRVAIHEVGHAIDHALDRCLGSAHHARIEDLYQEDLERARAGGPSPFLTERAGHNSREYFAEAVEAYFTRPVPDGHDHCRSRSNYLALRQNRPELFDYLEQIFNAEKLAVLRAGRADGRVFGG
ncbi:MAG: hypothetical protein HY319_05795 [Armatimonadetes bacterium]|nr:hypothetical protein [Armatimonadota bacterium]